MDTAQITRIRTRQAQARIQAETENARTAVMAAVAGGEGDRWRIYLPKELRRCYGQPDNSDGEGAFVLHFERRHGVA